MEPNPYDAPQSPPPRRWKIWPIAKLIAGALASALAGAIIIGLLTAPAGAIDGGIDFYVGGGAMLGLGIYVYSVRQNKSPDES